MRTVSRELGLIHNLRAAADHHKRTCDENCNVSLHSLKEAAVSLWVNSGREAEAPEVRQLLADWPS